MGDSYLVVFLEMSVEGEKYFETSPGATTSKTNRKFQDIWQKEFSWQLTDVHIYDCSFRDM
jgi:hypothetical protein